MANIRSLAVQGQEVDLEIQLYDAAGDKVDADKAPQIAIRNPDGETLLSSTKTGVYRIDTGLYRYTYRVPDDGEAGLWMDDWTATIDEVDFETTLFFSVIEVESSLSADSGPGKVSLGDDVVYDFSQEELHGINILLKLLKSRLRSTGEKPVRDEFGAFVKDGYGEIVTTECNVFDDEILLCFLCQALSEFNMIPFFTTYAFSDQIIYTLFSSAVTEGAYIFALASQSLIEKGREFTINDSGVSFQPAPLADHLFQVYSAWLASYRERLKFMKNSIRPGPVGFGTYTNLGSTAPALRRTRHLRSRRLF